MDGVSDQLASLPPSAKLVYKILIRQGALTRQELEQESRLASSTLTTALQNLRNVGIVERRPDVYNAQRPYYQLTDEYADCD